MEYKIKFIGEKENVVKATNALRDFNSILPAPEEIQIYKMIPISEDYFYYLLSTRGIISDKQGEKSLKRFETETANMNENVKVCYKFMAEHMLYLYDKYEACTLEAWREKNWGFSEQPSVSICENGTIKLYSDTSLPKTIIDYICEKYGVTAQIKA
jgi:hypothetical protein